MHSLGTCTGRCYITFTENHIRYTRIILLHIKDEALEAYTVFAAWAEKHHGPRIKRFRSRRGGELTRAKFVKFLKGQGLERVASLTPRATA